MTGIFNTALAGILALLAGSFINRKVPFLRRICIPDPVTGGIIFSLLFLALHSISGKEMDFDPTMKDICMVLFFTSVGFQSNIKVIREGGKPLLVMVFLVALLISVQNILGVTLAGILGQNKLLGMAAGSITMCGGHGTAGGFSELLKEMGLDGADSIAMAAATVGLLGGSLIGGPLGEAIISRKKLHDFSIQGAVTKLKGKAESKGRSIKSEELFKATCQLFIAIGIGHILNGLLSRTGITFPTYFGALVVGVLLRNFTELVPKCPKLAMNGIVCIGDISLSLFLGMAMVSLKLWELAGIALPLLVILFCQIIFILIFARTVAFPLLGRNYDAAVLVSGLCGFGLGATPNAIANMSAVCSKYHYSTMPFIVIPLVGALFADVINITIITLFLNLIQ